MASFTRPLQTPTPQASPSGARADTVFRGLVIAIAGFMLIVILAITAFVF